MSTGTTERGSAAGAEFADEVVTDAKLRYVGLPGVDGELALITLDNGYDHTKPNAFGPGGLQRLSAALDDVESHQPPVAGIALTGKPFIYNVGADITGIPKISERSQAEAIGKLGHDVFRRLYESKVPTFALVNGAVMGGGLESALHCHYRTISTGVPALALPECFLGLVPGWGGCYLLPNLIGADKAVTVMVENPLNNNKMLKGKQAFELGIADAIFEPADFLEESLLWVAKVLTGEVKVERPDVDRGQAWDDAVARGRAIADGKTHGYAKAPYRALDLIAAAKDSSLDEGYAGEEAALTDLIMSDELRAGIYAFNLVQRRAKRPVGVPDKSLAREVGGVGIVGAGLMASQLALLFVQRLEVPVTLTDVDQGRIDKGVEYVHGELDKLVSRKRMSADKASRLKGLVNGSLDKAAFAEADFVIEAVFEELGVKKQVFAELEQHCKPECVFATNTSSLSVTEMAADLQHPERVVGFHFFNPVAVLPLLEIIRAEKTDDPSLATAFAVGKNLKKSCVLVKDAPAFVFNRLISRALGEVIYAVDQGADFPEADAAVEALGMPMSPFMLLQLVGPAIALHTAETLHRAFPDRFRDSAGFKELVDAGKGGIYTWEGGSQHVDPEVEQLWKRGDAKLTRDEILDRTLSALAEEIRIMLDEQVVAEPQDIDLCMILGGGWAFWNGGITPLLDRTGVSEKVTGRRFLEPGVASLPA